MRPDDKTSQTVDSVQDVLDSYATGAAPQYREHAEKFRTLDRWTGSDPVFLIADAAGYPAENTVIGTVGLTGTVRLTRAAGLTRP